MFEHKASTSTPLDLKTPYHICSSARYSGCITRVLSTLHDHHNKQALFLVLVSMSLKVGNRTFTASELWASKYLGVPTGTVMSTDIGGVV